MKLFKSVMRFYLKAFHELANLQAHLSRRAYLAIIKDMVSFMEFHSLDFVTVSRIGANSLYFGFPKTKSSENAIKEYEYTLYEYGYELYDILTWVAIDTHGLVDFDEVTNHVFSLDDLKYTIREVAKKRKDALANSDYKLSWLKRL